MVALLHPQMDSRRWLLYGVYMERLFDVKLDVLREVNESHFCVLGSRSFEYRHTRNKTMFLNLQVLLMRLTPG